MHSLSLLGTRIIVFKVLRFIIYIVDLILLIIVFFSNSLWVIIIKYFKHILLKLIDKMRINGRLWKKTVIYLRIYFSQWRSFSFSMEGSKNKILSVSWKRL